MKNSLIRYEGETKTLTSADKNPCAREKHHDKFIVLNSSIIRMERKHPSKNFPVAASSWLRSDCRVAIRSSGELLRIDEAESDATHLHGMSQASHGVRTIVPQVSELVCRSWLEWPRNGARHAKETR